MDFFMYVYGYVWLVDIFNDVYEFHFNQVSFNVLKKENVLLEI